LCIKCSGLHRSLGTHISFVRSVSLDDWKEHEIQKMKETGNTKSNEIYEARVPPGYPRPKPGDTIGSERWIRDKYDAKRFIKKQTTPETSIPHSVPVTKKSVLPSQVYAEGHRKQPLSRPPTPTTSTFEKSSHSAEPEFGAFISTPISTPTTSTPTTSTPATSTPTTSTSTLSSSGGLSSDLKSNILSMYNIPQPQSPQVLGQGGLGQGGWPYAHPGYIASAPYYGYPNYYGSYNITPQEIQSDLIQKINNMAVEKRQQEFAVFNGH